MSDSNTRPDASDRDFTELREVRSLLEQKTADCETARGVAFDAVHALVELYEKRQRTAALEARVRSIVARAKAIGFKPYHGAGSDHGKVI